MRTGRLARHETDLGFKPRHAVRWLSPPQLARTGLRVLIAQVLTSFSDSRETQAVSPQTTLDVDRFKHADGHLWIDFVADLGDGFDATFTIASLLSQPELVVSSADGGMVTLPKSQLVLMGGDQVYPTASSQGYEDRMQGPYRAASGETPNAALLALPGNHDWYDGLTAFMRMFAQGASIGGWQTLQARSYFALQLQAGWWLVGLDSQLGEYLDKPQLDYFYQAITTKLQPGDAIILCASSPTWETTAYDPDTFNNLEFFENRYLRNRHNPVTGKLEATEAAVRLRISGDHHHYSRYAEQAPGRCRSQAPDSGHQPHDPRAVQLVVSGLGGAYLSGTDRLEPEIILPPEASRMRTKSRQHTKFTQTACVFPSKAESWKLYWSLTNPFSRYWLPIRNPWFGFWMGAIHLGLFAVLASLLGANSRLPLAEALRAGSFGGAMSVVGWAFGVPVVIFVVYRCFVALVIQRERPRGWQPLVGVVVQLVVSAGIFVVVACTPAFAGLSLVWVLVAVAAAGWVLGSEGFALFVVLAPPGTIGDYKMAGLAYEDGKGFVRMHLGPDGELTLYPLLVDTVVHDWDIVLDQQGQARPAASFGLPQMRLIEDPVVIARQGYLAEGNP